MLREKLVNCEYKVKIYNRKLTRATTNGKTRDDTSDDDLIPRMHSCDGDGVSNIEDATQKHNHLPSSVRVTKRASRKSTDETSNREDTSNQTFTNSTPGMNTIPTVFCKAFKVILFNK